VRGRGRISSYICSREHGIYKDTKAISVDSGFAGYDGAVAVQGYFEIV
jgi:hypothetical protein